jgi:virginiamycin A acetyltransferase
MEGVTIGDGAVIGAYAVIAKDVPPYAVMIGNPCRILKYRFSPEKIKELLEIKWWNLKDDIIREIVPQLQDPDNFTEFYENNKDKFGPNNRD